MFTNQCLVSLAMDGEPKSFTQKNDKQCVCVWRISGGLWWRFKWVLCSYFY